MAETEEERLQGWLGAIHSMLDEEIGARFRIHSSKSEEQAGRNSRLYHLLMVPRNMAAAALKGEAFIKPEKT